MSMKSMTMIPPMSRSLSWRTTSFTASRLFFVDRVLEPLRRLLRARADEAAGVDVDDRERLGVVEDEVSAGREVDAAVEGRRDLLLHPVPLEQRLLLLRAVDALDHVRRGLLQVADDPLVRAVVVDVRGARSRPRTGRARSAAAAPPPGRRASGALGGLRARLDRLPEPLQEDEVALDVLGGRALGRRADDDAALSTGDVLEDVLQPLPLGVLEPARDAEALAVRDVDEEAARAARSRS